MGRTAVRTCLNLKPQNSEEGLFRCDGLKTDVYVDTSGKYMMERATQTNVNVLTSNIKEKYDYMV